VIEVLEKIVEIFVKNKEEVVEMFEFVLFENQLILQVLEFVVDVFQV
jgi:hypothetical protein